MKDWEISGRENKFVLQQLPGPKVCSYNYAETGNGSNTFWLNNTLKN